MELRQLKFSVILLLVGLLLVTISCNQTPQPKQPQDSGQESTEFTITPNRAGSDARAPTLIVRLSIARQDADNRFGRASFFWTDTSGSTLNGTASIRLRQAGSSTRVRSSYG